MDFTGLITCIKLSIIMAKCGKNSSAPAARGASGWHQPRLASIARGAGTPGPRGGLARQCEGGWHAWPARGAGTPVRGGLARLARAGGWHACPRGGLARLAREGGWIALPARGAGTLGPRVGRGAGTPGLARELAPASRRASQACPARAGGWQGPARQAARPSLQARAPGLSRAGGGLARPRAPGSSPQPPGARPRPVPRGRGAAMAARGRSPQPSGARPRPVPRGRGAGRAPRARAQAPKGQGPSALGPRAPGPQAPVPQCPSAPVPRARARRARARACFVFDSRVFAGRKSGLRYRGYISGHPLPPLFFRCTAAPHPWQARGHLPPGPPQDQVGGTPLKSNKCHWSSSRGRHY